MTLLKQSKPIALVIGANGGLGKAISHALIENHEKVMTISRSISRLDSKNMYYAGHYCYDGSEESIKECSTAIAETGVTISKIIICTGFLHNNSSSDKTSMPEKRLEDFDPNFFLQNISANTTTPMLWLKHLTQIFNKKSQCSIAVFSARVGSIGDNRLGGWYSYRASKADLNMLMKTISIEYARRFPMLKVICYHPGTTNTELSKPFQASVAKEKLFNPEFVARRLLQTLESCKANGDVSFLDWDNKNIAW